MSERWVALIACCVAAQCFGVHYALAQRYPETLGTIQSTKTIRFGYRETALPFSFADKYDNPAGFSVELCKRVADGIRRQLGLQELTVRWVPVTSEDRFELVTSGKIDLECGTSTISLSRQDTVDFSLPIWIDEARFVSKADSGLRRLADLAGHRIAVIKGTFTETAVSEGLRRAYIDSSIVKVRDPVEGMAAVMHGTADAFAADHVILEGLILASGDSASYAVSEEPLSFELYGLVMRRNDADFRRAVNTVLARLYRSGEVVDVYAQWLRQLGKPSGLVLQVWALNGLPE